MYFNYLHVVIALLAVLIWREFSNWREIRFYRSWVNQLLENLTGSTIMSRSKHRIVERPLTDEEEAALEADRKRKKK